MIEEEEAGDELAEAEAELEEEDVDSEAADSEPGARAGERRLSFEFSGDAREYFRIWIVNFALTLLTLGLFSPWAKVRKKRYLYSHTVLDGTPFQYLGKPLPILKGRLLGAALAFTWFFVLNFEGQFRLVVYVLAVGLLPWVIVRSAAFNARYSAYRNLTFRFSGSYGGLVSAVIKPVLVLLVSCGLGYPWLRAEFNRYMVSRTSYGGVEGKLSRRGRHFLPAYLISGLGMVAVSCAVLLWGTARSAPGHWFNHRVFDQVTIATYAGYVVAFAYLKARITNVVWTGTRLGGVRFESTLAFLPLLWLYLSNSVLVLGSAGLLTPWAVMRVAKYRAARFAVWTDRSLEEFEGSDLSTVRAAGAEVGEMFDLDLAL